MSQAPRTMLDIQARTGEVMATLAVMPPAVAEALRYTAFDAVNHHRSSVLEHNQLKGKGRKSFLGAVLHRYARGDMFSQRPMDITAESFGAAKTNDILTNLEQGARIQTSSMMAVPFGKGINKDGSVSKKFKDHLEAEKFRLVPTRSVVLLIKDVGGGNKRSEIWGALTPRRQQRPQLNFMERWKHVEASSTAKFDEVLDKAMTASGRTSLARDVEKDRAAYEAYVKKVNELMAANGGKTTGAIRKAAKEAAKAAAKQAGIDIKQRSSNA